MQVMECIYLDVSGNQPQYATDESQITTGLYSTEDEDGMSYYFRGNVDNNNVQFGDIQVTTMYMMMALLIFKA